MSWIETIEPESADGELAAIYASLKKTHGGVDQVMKVHSLRPATMSSHLSLYQSVLHHPDNEVPRWLREAIGVLVSSINSCHYCLDHHFEGLSRALGDRVRALSIKNALTRGEIEASNLDKREVAALRYASRLTVGPAEADQSWVNELRESGWSDAEILEINQVTSYFAYVNRVVLGLGCSSSGETLGRSPAAVTSEQIRSSDSEF
ncbi:MAG: carboxymuconolactone decarboxylase family protein [Candidatus Nanopelagicaceae bacterium]